MNGYYYLHENGDLIHKPISYTEADFIESDFVKAYWYFDSKDRETAWTILVEGLVLGANKERVMELCEKWGCDDEDGLVYADRVGLQLSLDGDQWMANFQNFINLAESPAGFGNTVLEAIVDLVKDEGIHSKSPWSRKGVEHVARIHARD